MTTTPGDDEAVLGKARPFGEKQEAVPTGQSVGKGPSKESRAQVPQSRRQRRSRQAMNLEDADPGEVISILKWMADEGLVEFVCEEDGDLSVRITEEGKLFEFEE